MKKKLEEAYIPDKEGQKERVIIGLSGGIDSMVTAYLLKIQKYDLIGVTVLNSWDQFKGHQAEVLSCHIDQEKINRMKDFCHSISIPHFTVKSSEEFQDRVSEKWITGRITGTKSSPCWSCHELRMQLLYQKMLELGAKKMATGHFAKLFRNESGPVYVHTSNDELYDQSSLLSRIPQEILNVLLLPLADLQKKEVLKLAENFGLTDVKKKLKIHHCFDENPASLEIIEKNVPARFLAPGPIISMDGSEKFGEHNGIFHYRYGDEVISDGRHKVEHLLAHFDFSDKQIEVSDRNYFKKSHMLLVSCEVCEETPWIGPFKGVMKVGNEYVDCWINPKNLHAAYVTWEGKYEILEREVVSIYKKRGKNAKIYLTGMVRYLPEEETAEGDESEKVDYSSDL